MQDRIRKSQSGKSTGFLAVLFLSALWIGICLAGKIPIQALQPLLSGKQQGNIFSMLFWGRFLFFIVFAGILMRLLCGNLFRQIGAVSISFHLFLRAGYTMGVLFRLCEMYPLRILAILVCARWLICLLVFLWVHQRGDWSLFFFCLIPLCLFLDLCAAFILV